MSDDYGAGSPRDGGDLPLGIRIDWDHAVGEYQMYKEHGRPTGPYYMKCLGCDAVYEKTTLPDADHETRYHFGYHSGILGEEVEIVVTDNTGRELWRHHSIHRSDSATCDVCEEPLGGRDRVSCPNCGSIPEEARL